MRRTIHARVLNSLRLGLLGLALLAAGLCAGCATPDDSDIPWNAPQPWEGTPFTMPGMGQ